MPATRDSAAERAGHAFEEHTGDVMLRLTAPTQADAIRRGIRRATTTLENVRGAWIKEQHVIVENGNVSSFRVDMKVTFVLKDCLRLTQNNPYAARWSWDPTGRHWG